MPLKKSQSFEIDGDDGETLLTLSNDAEGVKLAVSGVGGSKSTVVGEDDWRKMTRALFPISRKPKDASSTAPAGDAASTTTTGRRSRK